MNVPGEDEIEAMRAHEENLRQRKAVRQALKDNNGILRKW
ncbi:hypothetical protein LCGC14_1564860 [marine sediment metagenome]|uniref:Uncharacterized protein n=1 Tax=marine sediment metagenome TaxID=412755 RepID=A0A0F9ILB8_9ZZZZ